MADNDPLGPVRQANAVSVKFHKMAKQDPRFAAFERGDRFYHTRSGYTFTLEYGDDKNIRPMQRGRPKKKEKGDDGLGKMEDLLFTVWDPAGTTPAQHWATGPSSMAELIPGFNREDGKWVEWEVFRQVNGSWRNIGTLDAMRDAWNALLPPDKAARATQQSPANGCADATYRRLHTDQNGQFRDAPVLQSGRIDVQNAISASLLSLVLQTPPPPGQSAVQQGNPSNAPQPPPAVPQNQPQAILPATVYQNPASNAGFQAPTADPNYPVYPSYAHPGSWAAPAPYQPGFLVPGAYGASSQGYYSNALFSPNQTAHIQAAANYPPIFDIMQLGQQQQQFDPNINPQMQTGHAQQPALYQGQNQDGNQQNDDDDSGARQGGEYWPEHNPDDYAT